MDTAASSSPRPRAYIVLVVMMMSMVMFVDFSLGGQQADGDDLAVVNAVVAQDGSGDYTTVGAAVAAAPRKSTTRYTIHVKTGVYREVLRVDQHMWNLTLIGDGVGATVITADRGFDDGFSTSETATVGVDGPGFIMKDLTVQNTAGASKHQAVALRLASNRSIVYRCSLEGYQDTVYAERGVQFYRDCGISGTVDFIFGNAIAVFQNCSLSARLPLAGQQNVVTAQGRFNANDSSGFVFQFCTVIGDPRLGNTSTETYLGRPWKPYSRVLFMESYLDGIINPLGYLPWNGSIGINTLYYAEYNNKGVGADVRHRVKWQGYHGIISAIEAGSFTVKKFIDGSEWIMGTGVPYTPGL